MVILILITIFPNLSWSRDCKSLLFPNLNPLGETGLYYGTELRGSYYFVKEQEEQDNIFLPSLSLGLQYEAPKNIFLQFQVLARRKDKVHDKSCENEWLTEIFDFETGHGSRNRYGYNNQECSSEGLNLNIRQAWAEIPFDPLIIRSGRMNLAFGNQLVLDNWFDSVELNLSLKKLDVSLFGGILAKDVARGVSSCQHCIVYENRLCWTNICKSDWGDHKLLGATLSYKLLKEHHQSLLIMKQETPYESMDSDIASLYFNGKLISNFKYFGELGYQKYKTSESTIGFSGIIRGYFKKENVGLFQVGLGYLYENKPFDPVYGSLWLGERQRYMVTNGKVLSFETEFTPSFTKYLKFGTYYYLQLSRNDNSAVSNEIDLEALIKFSDKRRFWLVYSILNFQGELEKKQQVKLETRLIF